MRFISELSKIMGILIRTAQEYFKIHDLVQDVGSNIYKFYKILRSNICDNESGSVRRKHRRRENSDPESRSKSEHKNWVAILAYPILILRRIHNDATTEKSAVNGGT